MVLLNTLIWLVSLQHFCIPFYTHPIAEPRTPASSKQPRHLQSRSSML